MGDDLDREPKPRIRRRSSHDRRSRQPTQPAQVDSALRAERAWSQQRLGDELGVSRQTINSIEQGKYDPSLHVAFRLARTFDCYIEDIFTD